MTDESHSFCSSRPSIKSSCSTKQSAIESDTNLLQSYVSNLKSNVSLNRQIVLSLISSKPSESFEDTSSSATSGKLIENLINENKNLEEKIEKVFQERNEFQTKSFLNKQIQKEWELSQKELEAEYKEQISEIKLQNERKNKAIDELKQLNSVLRLEADLAIKSKHVFEVKPSPDILNVHCQVEQVRGFIEDQARKNFTLQSQFNFLESFIEETQKKMLMVRALLANPLNRKNNIEKKEFFVQKTGEKVEEPLSRQDSKVKKFTLTQFDKDEEEKIWYKKALKEKSEKLLKIYAKNLKIQTENERIFKENEGLAKRVSKMYSEYYREDMTTEINQEYESSFCYKIQAVSLDSIVEVDVNHSHFYESEEEGI